MTAPPARPDETPQVFYLHDVTEAMGGFVRAVGQWRERLATLADTTVTLRMIADPWWGIAPPRRDYRTLRKRRKMRYVMRRR